jgi:uncharacterized membrane protein YdcZ (DUF606 family)
VALRPRRRYKRTLPVNESRLMITSYRTALWIAIVSGVILGAFVGLLRRSRDDDELPATMWAFMGGLCGALIFGALVVFHGVFYFFSGPEPVGSIVAFAILTEVLFAVVFGLM